MSGATSVCGTYRYAGGYYYVTGALMRVENNGSTDW